MKRISIFALFSIVLFSCQQTEFEFSCDPVINKIVIENKAEFSQVSVSLLAAYDISLQKAVFRSWTPEKKRNAWLDKLHLVLETHTFKEEETEHIQRLIEHITSDYFLNSKITAQVKSRLNFADEWLNYASTELGWSEQFIAFLVYRLYTTESQFDEEINLLKSISVSSATDSESGSCNCNTSADFCSYSNCTSSGCTTSSGCGWLWSGTCNGNC